MAPVPILFLSEYFYPFDRGGSEWSVYHLAQGLLKKGFQITVFTPNYGAQTNELYENIAIHRFPFYLKLKKRFSSVTPFFHSNVLWFAITFVSLLQFCLQNKPQIIHIHGKYFLPAAVLVGKLLQIKTVITLRDYIVLCPYGLCITEEREYRRCTLKQLLTRDMPMYYNTYVENKKFMSALIVFISGLYGYMVSQLLQFLLKKVDIRIAISKKVKTIYEANGISIHNVIYNSISPDNFLQDVDPRLSAQAGVRKSSESEGKDDNYGGGEGNVLFIGRLTPGKGIELLLQAYSVIAKELAIKLTIIGIGPNLKAYEKKYPDVLFLGHIPQREVTQQLTRAALLIVPSIWEEPFGRVALEGLAAGIPVVVTNRGALPEIIEDGVTGVICEPTIDALAKGIEKTFEIRKKLVDTIKTTGKKLEQKFGKQPIIAYTKLYQQ